MNPSNSEVLQHSPPSAIDFAFNLLCLLRPEKDEKLASILFLAEVIIPIEAEQYRRAELEEVDQAMINANKNMPVISDAEERAGHLHLLAEDPHAY